MTTQPSDRTPFYRLDNFVAGNSVGYLLKTASNLMQPALESAFSQGEFMRDLRDRLTTSEVFLSRVNQKQGG